MRSDSARASGGLLSAGILMSLAFLTKQTAPLAALPLIVYVWLAKRRGAAWTFAGSFLLLVVLATAVLNVATRGWFGYYVFSLPAYHDTLPGMLTSFWTVDLAKPMGIAMALSVVGVTSRLAEDVRKQFAFFAALGVGLVGVSWLGRLHGAGYDNVLQPAYAFLAIGMVVGAHALETQWLALTGTTLAPVPAPAATPVALSGAAPAAGPADADVTAPAAGGPGRGDVFASPGRAATSLLLSLYCVGLMQFALLWYSPSGQIPSKEDAMAGDRLMVTVSRIDGDVWIPYHGYLAAMAGHPAFTCHAMAVNDVLRGPAGEPRRKLLADIGDAIANRRFAAIILDDEWLFKTTEWQPIMKALAEGYTQPQIMVDDKTTFLPVTGDRNRPTMLLVKRRQGDS
jgi:hypothetical protein